MDERLKRIQEEARERRKPTLENLLRDVSAIPGHYCIGFKSRFSPIADVQEWRKVIKQALRDGHIERDWRGKFWPPGAKPPARAVLRALWEAPGKPLLIWLAGVLALSVIGAAIQVTTTHLGFSEVAATEWKNWITIPVFVVWTRARLGN